MKRNLLSWSCGLIPVLLWSCLALHSTGGSAVADEFQLQGVPNLLADGRDDSDPPELELTARLVAEKLAVGETATLLVTVRPPEGFYIYSTSRKFGGRTRISLDESEPNRTLEPIDETFRSDHAPKVVFEPLLEQEVEKFFGEVTWYRRFRIKEGTDLDRIAIAGELTGQYCNSGPGGACIAIRPPRKFTATLAQGDMPQFVVDQPTPAYDFRIRPTQREQEMPVEVFARLQPENAKPGERVTLEVGLKLDDDWHAFSLTQPPGQAAVPTNIRVATEGLKPLDEEFSPRSKPETLKIAVGDETYTQEAHHDEIVWTRTFEVVAGEGGDAYGVGGKLLFQLCREGTCLLPETVDFALGEISTQALSTLDEKKSEVAEETSTATGLDPSKQGLVPFLVAAVLAGFAALLTPCVFPMVPITVSIFLKESEKESHRPFWMASIYCAGFIVTFTVLGLLMAVLFGATKISEFANYWWLNLGIAAVLVFFGLNLLGMFELRVPTRLLNWTSGKKGQGGVIGVLFMSFTFTLVSFTCTFAFAGMLLVWAAKGQYYWPILGMAAFSAAFSLPFFFLALFPSFLQKLPKSGGWMNTVKVVMGMIEIGAALKFFNQADQTFNALPIVFDYSFVMVAWITLAACTGLYLLGLFRLSHDTPVESVAVPRLVLAVFFLGFAGYLSVGLFGARTPTGKIWEQVAAFAPPTFEGGKSELGPYLTHDDLKYALDFDQAVNYAKERNEPLFLDFTGVNCVNCRLMEKRMEQPQNRQRLERFVRVQLYTDNVPHLPDRAKAAQLLERNRELQSELVKDVTLPLYAVATPDGRILVTYEGMEEEEGEFAAFLDQGLRKWNKLARGTTSNTHIARAE